MVWLMGGLLHLCRLVWVSIPLELETELRPVICNPWTLLQSTLHFALLRYLLSLLQVNLILEQSSDLPCQV